MMRMGCFVEAPEALLEQAGARLARSPELLKPLPDGTGRILIDLPSNWRRRIMRRASKAALCLSHGVIIDFSEIEGDSSGGLIGSCMSSADIAAFLREWLKQTKDIQAPLPLGQLELFN